MEMTIQAPLSDELLNVMGTYRKVVNTLQEIEAPVSVGLSLIHRSDDLFRSLEMVDKYKVTVTCDVTEFKDNITAINQVIYQIRRICKKRYGNEFQFFTREDFL